MWTRYDSQAGIFAYGFAGNGSTAGLPYAFYMKGVPWVANWMWQRFGTLQEVTPPPSTWDIPASCATADRCPGW